MFESLCHFAHWIRGENESGNGRVCETIWRGEAVFYEVWNLVMNRNQEVESVDHPDEIPIGEGDVCIGCRNCDCLERLFKGVEN